MKLLRSVWNLATQMVAISPVQAAASVLLVLAVSATEGLGLLLLMPLLTLVGVEEPNTLPRVTGWFDAAFAIIGLEPSLGGILVLYVGISGCRALLQRAENSVAATFRESFTSTMRVRVYRAIAGAEWQFLVTRRSSEFVHALAGEIGRIGGASSQLIELAVLVTASVVYIGVAIHLSPAVAGIVLLSAAILAWAVRGSLDRARRSSARASKARARLHAAIAEHMESLKTAKSYGVTDRHTEVFVGLSHDVRDTGVEVSAGHSDLNQTLEFGSTLLLAAIVFASLELLHVPAAPMLVLLFSFARLMPRLVTIYRRVQTLAGVLPEYDAVMNLEQECAAAAETATRASCAEMRLSEQIRLEHVSYTYPRRVTTPALADLNLEILAGRTTAIVGPSGAGKSTVADLLLGLLSPTTGRILVDGQTLSADRIAAWRRGISYVPQDTFLFHDTIRANLTWACPEAIDAELWQALRLAAADEFVAALPQKLDTVIGERGVLVSGGERQRLSLARALVRRPRILVLDEATSALDSENERRIQDAVNALHGRMTIVIITHRLSTIRDADVINVLDSGRLVETGSWDDLMDQRDSRFRELCRAQGIEHRPRSVGLGLAAPRLR